MERLLLTSYFKMVASCMPEFLDGACEGKTVCFIPTASIPEKVDFCVGSGKRALLGLGMKVTQLEVSTASREEIESGIRRSDILYVAGGNTFFLLQELKRTGADKLIVEQIKAGKPYVGESAGSVIAAPDIGYVQKMDSVKAAPDLHGDYRALNVIDFAVVPHVGNAPFKKATEWIMKTYSDEYDLRPISNNQAIRAMGSQVDVLTVE